MANTALTPAQNAFIDQITGQVNTMLSSQLPGKFEVVSYPPGFNYGIQFSQPLLTNALSLKAFDSLLSRGSNGVLTLAPVLFSTTYLNILTSASYQFSADDQNVVDDPAIMAQEGTVLSTATSSGYLNQFPITGTVNYYNLIKSVLANFGPQNAQINSSDIAKAVVGLNNAGFIDLGQAISSLINQLAPLNAILNTQSLAEGELAAAKANTQHPSAANYGEQIGNNPIRSMSVGRTCPLSISYWEISTAAPS